MDNRRLVRAGRDPLAEKRRVRVPTFRVATKGFLETHRRRWSASHATAWWKSFENHVFPRFGDRRVDQIASADVLALLLRLSVQHPDAARRLRDRIRRVFASCLSHGFVQTNVAGEVIDDALPDGRPPEQHFLALPYRDVPDAYRRIAAAVAAPQVQLCLQFIILTAVRGHEAREARWSDINCEERIWTIPASQTKTRRHDHSQPLSSPALDVLSQARVFGDGSGLIFPSPATRGGVFSRPALYDLLAKVGLKGRTHVHGFRASFRTWADECTDADFESKELSLGHRERSASVRPYARGDFFDFRRALMEQWAFYLTSSP